VLWTRDRQVFPARVRYPLARPRARFDQVFPRVRKRHESSRPHPP